METDCRPSDQPPGQQSKLSHVAASIIQLLHPSVSFSNLPTQSMKQQLIQTACFFRVLQLISWTEKATLTTWFLEDVPILFLIINANLRLPHSRKRDRKPWVLFLYLTGKICSWKPRREFMQTISQCAYLVTSVWTFLTLFFLCLYLKCYITGLSVRNWKQLEGSSYCVLLTWGVPEEAGTALKLYSGSLSHWLTV